MSQRRRDEANKEICPFDVHLKSGQNLMMSGSNTGSTDKISLPCIFSTAYTHCTRVDYGRGTLYTLVRLSHVAKHEVGALILTVTKC